MTSEKIKDIANVIEAMNFIAETFGENEFTSKQYNSVKRKGGACISTLAEGCWRQKPILQIVREETFAVEVPSSRGAEMVYIVDKNGKILMQKREFDRLQPSVRNIMESMNGEPFKTVAKNVQIVEGVRFFYKLDKTACDEYADRKRDEVASRIEKMRADREKLDRQIKAFESFSI